MFRLGLAAALLASISAAPAAAQQFMASSDVMTPSGVSSSYSGPGTAGSWYGVVSDGGFDAFDGHGHIYDLGSLTLHRETALLTGTNTYRFLDTFTNSTGSSITQTVRFYSNLGSDGREYLQFTNSGAVVTCDSPACTSWTDPALALIYSNNGFGTGTVTPGQFNARFDLEVAPGQSVSLLNYAFLARDLSDRSGDRALAISTAQALQANPNVSGLSEAQLARVVNFDLNGVGAVPEPGTWAMMLFGFGGIGFAMRRRRKVEGTLRFA